MQALAQQELLALLPLTLISLTYWMRDRYVFNRVPSQGCTTTTVQKQVLFVVYPLFVFFYWSSRVQLRRGRQSAVVSTITAGMIQHYASTAILNDSFRQTRQQVVGYVITVFFAFLWMWFEMTMYSGAGQRE